MSRLPVREDATFDRIPNLQSRLPRSSRREPKASVAASTELVEAGILSLAQIHSFPHEAEKGGSVKDHISRWLFESMPPTPGLYARLGSHQTMLMDDVRCRSYQKAIGQVVRPGDVVVDAGTGTGILAFFAAKAGAKRVYAIEASPIASIADHLIMDNGLQAQVVLIRGRAQEVELPEKIDVIVSETVGCWGVDENILGLVSNLFLRFGRETTRVIPDTLELYLVPIENQDFYDRVEFWSKDIYGFDYSYLTDIAANNVYVRTPVAPRQFLAAPALVGRLRLPGDYRSEMRFGTMFRIQRSGRYHGLAGWFRMRLAPRTWISTDPRREMLHWKQCVFPSLQSLGLSDGDSVRAELVARIVNDQVQFDWQTSFSRGDEKETFAQHKQSTSRFEELTPTPT